MTEPINEIINKLILDDRVRIISDALTIDQDLCLVGGTVRDLFLQRENTDLDFATTLLPDQIKNELEKKHIRVIPTGLKHQTITAYIESLDCSVEITTFRDEGMSPEGGVKNSNSVITDLQFRDFTINSLAINIQNKILIDPNMGIKDLQNKIIKGVGDPAERFSEDPLRILRMIRFSETLDFKIDDSTFLAGKNLSQSLKNISIERIREEFNKILLSNKPSRGLQSLLNLGALDIFLPEISRFKNFEQNKFHKADLFDHTIEVVDNVECDLITRLAALFHDVGKPDTLTIDEDTGDRHFYLHEDVGTDICQTIMKRMKYSNLLIDAVSKLVKTHMRPLSAGPGGLRRILRDTDPYYLNWRNLKESDAKACKIESHLIDEQLKDFDERMNIIQNQNHTSPFSTLAIKGADLIDYGLKPSPKFGEILRALHEIIIENPELNTKDQILDTLLPEIIKKLAA